MLLCYCFFYIQSIFFYQKQQLIKRKMGLYSCGKKYTESSGYGDYYQDTDYWCGQNNAQCTDCKNFEQIDNQNNKLFNFEKSDKKFKSKIKPLTKIDKVVEKDKVNKCYNNDKFYYKFRKITFGKI
jgi:hypothetical protein